MSEQSFVDGLIWCFAVGGGLMALFFLVLGVAVMALFVRETARKLKEQRKPQKGASYGLH